MNPPGRALPSGVDEEGQHEHEEQMDRAMNRRDDVGGGGPEVVQGHYHQCGGDGASEQAGGVPGLPLERLDQFFDFCRRLRQLAGRWFGHGLGATVMINRVPSPAWYSGRSVVPTRSRGCPVRPTRSTISRRWAAATATRKAPSRRYGALRPL